MRLFKIISRLAVAASIVASCAVAQDPLITPYATDQCSSCAEWSAPRVPFQLFANTYYVGTQGLSAILITAEDGHILIDGGLPDSAPRFCKASRRWGLRCRISF
ncbi:hypothetical protein BH23GEM6_BH23GEM6_24370 [soil metagenome]